MASRSQKEVNEVGFKALVDALGRDDAMRFIRQFGGSPSTVAAATEPVEDDTINPMTIDEAHERIRDMHDPTQQASML